MTRDDILTLIAKFLAEPVTLIPRPFSEEFISNGPPAGQIVCRQLNRAADDVNQHWVAFKESLVRFRNSLHDNVELNERLMYEMVLRTLEKNDDRNVN